MLPAERFDVFLSYAVADTSLITPFVAHLQREGISVWFDVERMEGGRPTMEQMVAGIEASSHTIACLTDRYLQRQWTRFELTHSLQRDPNGDQARTIPVRFEALTRALPGYIAHLTVSDLTNRATYTQVFERISRTVIAS